MWPIFKALFAYELRRLGRWILRRPEPPGRFVRYREQLNLDSGPVSESGDDPGGRSG